VGNCYVANCYVASCVVANCVVASCYVANCMGIVTGQIKNCNDYIVLVTCLLKNM
jgi:hypothetical protein